MSGLEQLAEAYSLIQSPSFFADCKIPISPYLYRFAMAGILYRRTPKFGLRIASAILPFDPAAHDSDEYALHIYVLPQINVDHYRTDWLAHDYEVLPLDAFIGPGSCAAVRQYQDRTHFVRVCFSQKVASLPAAVARILGCLPRIFPDLFTGANALTPEETVLLEYLFSSNDTKKKILADQAALSLLRSLNLQHRQLTAALTTLVSQSEKRSVQRIQNSITSNRNLIEELQTQIQKLIAEIQDQQIKLEYWQRHEPSAALAEVLDYCKNQEIVVNNYSSNSMEFTVHTVLSNYDESLVQNYVLTNPSVLKTPRYSPSRMRQFYQKLLLDHEFQLKLAARYRITECCAVSGQRSNAGEDLDFIPNPHIQEVACLGGYTRELARAQEMLDFTAAIAICQQSAGSVNPGESWTFRRITQYLEGSTGRVIRTPQGDITFAECMSHIQDENE